ncbi:MAG: polyprenyl synthetase family protein [Rhizobiales bacterium]|nr:polyprenyl synthetase family protein [Hyphomicrobiales bacterium]
MEQIEAERFTAALAATAQRVQRLLDDILCDASAPGEIVRPQRVLQAMRHGALAGGKRLRPFLTIETAALFGRRDEGPLRAGAALELVHCYSLVHDDLPAMDDDDLRRGQPTVHKAFDEATAILAGDGLLTLAFDVIADASVDADAEIRLALSQTLARAAGLGGMVGGQALDLAAEAAAVPLAAEDIERLQAMKTGALLAWAVDAGAILGRADPAERAALRRYGRALGACFQIADDILDAESDAATLGKRAGKDAGRNKATLVAALGLDAAKARRDALAADAGRALDALAGRDATTLRETARFVARRLS